MTPLTPQPMKTPSRKKRILLVEDDPLVGESIKTLLEKEGYDVRLVTLGVAALDPAFSEVLDLVISDVRMPGMNGLEAIRAIREVRKQFDKPPIPEIVLTAYDDKAMSDEARRLGIRDFILKPFEVKSFLAAVRKRISDSREIHLKAER